MAAYPLSNFPALLGGRCPRCHQGKLFSTSGWHPTTFADMPPTCPRCGQTFEPEPGFYYGAMFISFGFSVALFLTVGVAVYYLGHDPELWVYVTAVTVGSLLLVPVSYRASRTLMLYGFGFIPFDPAVAEAVAAGTYQIPAVVRRRRGAEFRAASPPDEEADAGVAGHP